MPELGTALHLRTRCPAARARRRPLTRSERSLVGFELFLAGGALVGGGGMLLDTTGRGQGLPSDLLDGTPFGSYVIPGIVLLAFNGLLPVVVAVLTLRRRPLARVGHFAVALVLSGWLAAETFYIGLESWMQPFFLAYALVLALLALAVPRDGGAPFSMSPS